MGPFVTIEHTKSGAVATVNPHGATVTSFVTSSGEELLFLSRLAKMDGSKAIRGGIPLVFPQFGKGCNIDMPQHGFLRNNSWKAGVVRDGDTEAVCDFSLSLTDAVNDRGTGQWGPGADEGYECNIRLSVSVSSNALATVLSIENSGKIAFDYQALFHTYYKIHGSAALDKNSCNVSGLAGYSVKDQITEERYIQGEKIIFVDREIDRIYTPPSGKNTLDVIIRTGKDGSKINVESLAFADGVSVPISVVVWNPHLDKSKGMGDFGDDEYNDMICVEPGILSGVETIKGSKEMIFTQIISKE